MKNSNFNAEELLLTEITKAFEKQMTKQLDFHIKKSMIQIKIKNNIDFLII